MKNDNLTHDWLDYLSEVKSANRHLSKIAPSPVPVKEQIIKTGERLKQYSSPRTQKIKGIVIHITVTKSAKSTESVLYSRGLSTNYEVDQEGKVYEYLDPEKYVSWATGANANEHTIGIDVTNLGNEPFPDVQIQALKKLVNDLANRFNFELKLAPDIGPYNWSFWKDKEFTLFRHRNFVNKSCPSHLPMEELASPYSPIDRFSGNLERVYGFIKKLGTKAKDKFKSLVAESIDRKLFDIQDNSEKQIYQKYQKYFDALLNFLKKELKITKPVKIIFEEDKKNSKKPLGRTGGYLNEENKIHIFVTGRHVKDVMRSLAHEMVHHRQNIRGEFKKAEPTTKGYAQKSPHLRKMEKEAFLKGNMLFRDWEDNYKYRGK